MYVNTYLTVQTDKQAVPIIKQPNIVSVPKYSGYNAHQETPEYKAASAAIIASEKSIYDALMPHGRYSQPSVDFSRIAVLAAKEYLPSTFTEGSLGSVVGRSEHIGPAQPLKVNTGVKADLRVLEDYSFCNDLLDSAMDVPLKCAQEEFKKMGVPFNQRIRENLSGHSWKEIKRIANVLSLEMSRKKTKKKVQIINGVEILMFNRGTNAYIDRVTEFTGNAFKMPGLEEGIEITIEYIVVANIIPPKEVSCSIRMTGPKSMIYVTDLDKIPIHYDPALCWKLKKGPNRIFGTWSQSGHIGNITIQTSPCNGVYTNINPSWLNLVQEPNAPLFSWEGHAKTFHEIRFPNIMVLALSPKLKIVETESIFPILLQLKTGTQSGFATLERSIAMNSWRTITCAFVASVGKGILFSFGPLIVRLLGTSIQFTWSTVTLEVNHNFKGLINLDGSTPYLAVIGMKSDLDGIYPNRLTVYIGSFEDWNAGRVTIEKLGMQGATFTTKDFSAIYNTSDSVGLTIGHDTSACNAAVAWIRVFDYEMTSPDVVRDVRNLWA
jgi:hypothetical protein